MWRLNIYLRNYVGEEEGVAGDGFAGLHVGCGC